ncbi:hypothetical protein [Streptomyces sp. NPDC053367]|uniref:hypothetical protein n=1 Tax=Streptomyces sp. NPDC053367 TaxID=3365700 RepID=UPI0037D8F9C6
MVHAPLRLPQRVRLQSTTGVPPRAEALDEELAAQGDRPRADGHRHAATRGLTVPGESGSESPGIA